MRAALLISLTMALSTRAAAEPLVVVDRGIFSDLDAAVNLPTPAPTRPHAIVDPRHHVVVLWDGDRPVKVYPNLDDPELRHALGVGPVRVLAPGDPTPGGDADDDGIPDELDLVLGAHKVALNGAAYVGGYVEMPYPGGDVPRATGVCTDVIVRALRNAGIDLQKELYLDIGRAPSAYPMVKRRDPSIDQRRVATILPWFRRNFVAHGVDPRDPNDPFRPGDILFMDTFPRRDGPEHVGIVGDRLGPSGLPLVINNWTDGYRESEMDLLTFVPVTNRFRVPGASKR
jgi:uncharacterized protein YijF (DUF1287 family)